MKDLNDAAVAGKADGLLAAAERSVPVAPADVAPVAADGIKHLKAIISQVQIDLKDPLNGVNTASENMVRAVQSERHRWILGAAAHQRAAEVESLIAFLASVAPGRARNQVASIRKVISAGKKDFEKSVEERNRLSDSIKRPSPRLLAAVIKDLGDFNFRMPNGYEMDLDGIRTDTGEVVSTAPILPISIEEMPDGEVYVTVAWKKWDRWIKHKFSRAILASSKRLVDLASKGAPVDSITAPLLMAYFSAFERVNEAELRPQLAAPHVGWNGNTFLYGTQQMGEGALTAPNDPSAAQFFLGFKSSGTWEAWCRVISDHVSKHPSVMAGIYGSVASLLLEPLGERGFVLDWSGLTSVGKTTTLMVAASSLGNPAEADQSGLIRSWRGPSNTSRMFMAAMLHSFPLYLDETKRADKSDIVRNFLYDFPSGQDSMRAKEDGTARIAKRWRSIALTTGEAPITSFARDGGAHARAICLQGPPWGRPTAAQALIQKEIVEQIHQNYGHLGPRFVWHLLKTDKLELRDRFREILEGYPPLSGVGSRMLSYVATIELAAEICHQSLGLPGDYRPTIDMLVASVDSGTVGANMAKQAAETLYQWCSANREKFWHPKASNEPYGGWYGRWDPDDMAPEFIAFDQNKASKYLIECGFDAPSVWTAFRENGWMLLTASKANPQVGPSRSRLPCVKISALRDN
jgi:putative DNA primase/helicase